MLFEDVLPAEFLVGIDKTKRNRHFGAIPVFWAWLGQILEENASCSRGLSLIQTWCVGAGLKPPTGDTSSYCQSRMLVVVTTLLDPEKHDGLELIDLYAKRWDIEVKIRDVKTTLGMEEFAGKSPAMAHKTLLMMMISYNLLRSLMQRSAAHAGKPLVEMSFKGTLDALNTMHPLFRGLGAQHRKRARLREELIEICSTKLLDIRPFRQEPRAIKRRPKPFQYLTAPRHIFREIHHKEQYRKAA
jgi:hypothetical protein